MDVVIVATGIANVASVAAALRRCGATVELTADPARVRDASRVVLPGVGSFGAGMAALRAGGLDDALAERVESDRPLLAVCLGLQVLCRASEESPGVVGLGLIDADVRRFPMDVRSPQFGWNAVDADGACRVVASGWAYYANSFRVVDAPAGWAVASSDHGGPFAGALERGNIVACQFHPELSGLWGLGLIRRWLVREEAGVTC